MAIQRRTQATIHLDRLERNIARIRQYVQHAVMDVVFDICRMSFDRSLEAAALLIVNNFLHGRLIYISSAALNASSVFRKRW